METGEELVRTYLVFKDLPVHVEYRTNDMPLIPEGIEIRFKASLRHPNFPKRIRKMDGIYKVIKRRLIYSSDRPSAQGLSQYLELDCMEDK
jgi:hypothetical protein